MRTPACHGANVPIALAALLSLGAGCSSTDGEAPAPSATGPVARYDVPAQGPFAFGDAPFPNDLHLDAAGKVDIAALPGDKPVWEDVRALLNTRRGFCTSCTVHFPIDGVVARDSLGEDAAVGAEASPADPVVMLDVGPESPERGGLVPLRVQYDDENGLVTVRPVRGVVLTPRHSYAVALTSRVRGLDGAPVQPAPMFAAARDGAGAGDGALGRLHALAAPALTALEQAGVPRAAVASLAVFTTDDPSEHAASVASLVAEHYGSGAPAAAFDRLWRADDGSLDKLMGTPAEGSKPGMDAAPAPGVEGTRAVAHATTAFLLSGSFPSPRIVAGKGTDVGTLRLSEDGKLEAGPEEQVPFLLTVPKGADLTKLPVVIVHWGMGGRRQNSLVFADTFGQLGVAVLGIDAYQHGARADSAEDKAHDLRGDDGFMGPDGLDEHSFMGVMSRAFGLAGTEADVVASPRFGLAALSQMAADLLATVRFVRQGDLAALAAADPALAGLAFDPGPAMLVGESLGTVAATTALTADSGVGAAVLGVAPGSLIDIFCESPVYRAQAELIFMPVLGVEGELDEHERRMSMHPLLNLFRWALEPVEAQALARRLLREATAEGARPDLLWQFGELDESLGTAAPDALLAAAGVPAEGSFEFAALPAGEPPFHENVTTPQGAVTAGGWRFAQAGHGMLGTIHQSSGYEPPIVPPFVSRDHSLDFENPTELTHAQIAAFFEAWMKTGRAEIRAPK
ncbi:MAG: hypothetical protein HY744_17415 [Deltaproteobacteria bacterium]|nr:hypothetical protein [Deltaproteobacteria bacterium]